MVKTTRSGGSPPHHGEAHKPLGSGTDWRAKKMAAAERKFSLSLESIADRRPCTACRGQKPEHPPIQFSSEIVFKHGAKLSPKNA